MGVGRGGGVRRRLGGRGRDRCHDAADPLGDGCPPQGLRDGPALGDRGTPRAIAAIEDDDRARLTALARLDDPQPVAHRLQQPPVVGHDEHRRRGLPQERLERLAGRYVEVVRGLIEQQQVRGRDAQQRQLQPGALAARQLGHGLEHILTPEQEAGQVGPGRSVLDPAGGQDGVHDRRARDGRLPDLGQIPRLDVAAQTHEPIERRQDASDGPQERRLARAIRPHDPDTLTPGRLDPCDPQDGHASWRGRVSREADEHGLQRQCHVTGTRRATAEQRLGRQRQPRLRAGRFRLRSEQRIEPLLVLVHLGVLAVAAIPLDELALARDLLGHGVRVLAPAGIRRLALLEIRGVATLEWRQTAVAELPDAGDHRIQEGAVVGRDQERALASGEIGLQPFQGGEVQVVGGLIEQQQVGVIDQQASQRDPCLLAARQADG